MGEWYMVVGDVIEEVDFLLLEEECGSDGVHGSVSPAFVEESTIFIKSIEVIQIGRRSQPVEVPNFEIRPLIMPSMLAHVVERKSNVEKTYEMAMVIGFALIITQPVYRITLSYVLWVFFHELLGAIPQGWDRIDIFVKTNHETVFFAMILHVLKGIIGNVTVELNAWLNPPIPFVLIHQCLTEEKTRLESAHVPITSRVSVDNFSLVHVLPDLASFFLVNPFRETPMFLRDLAIVSFPRYEGSSDLLKLTIKWLVVEEYPIIMVIPVKSILNMADRLHDFPEISVPGQGYKGSIYFPIYRQRRGNV